MNEYELIYVISPRLMVEEADATIERIQGLIEDTGGEILMTDNWGRRRLAYPIKHHFEGTYVLTHIMMPPDRIAGFERALNINENVLRHLLVRGIIPGYDGPPEEEVMYQRRASSRPPPRDDTPPPEAGPEAAEAPAVEPEAAEASAVEPEAAEASAVEPEAAEAPAAAPAE